MRSLMTYAQKKGYKLGGWLPENDEDTYIDEVLGWTLAAIGFYVQFKFGFGMPFPFNLILWPFEMLEWYIQWKVTEE